MQPCCAQIINVAICLLMLGTASCSDSKVGNLRISVSKKRTLESMISVHGEAQTVLTINGRKFEGVRGGPPYYLPIPELKAIIFVTKRLRPDYATAYHIVKTESGEVIDVPVLYTQFGREIGAGQNRDKVEKVDGDLLVLSSENKNVAAHYKTYYSIDMAKKVLVREVTYSLDSKGETNSVHENPLDGINEKERKP